MEKKIETLFIILFTSSRYNFYRGKLFEFNNYVK